MLHRSKTLYASVIAQSAILREQSVEDVDFQRLLELAAGEIIVGPHHVGRDRARFGQGERRGSKDRPPCTRCERPCRYAHPTKPAHAGSGAGHWVLQVRTRRQTSIKGIASMVNAESTIQSVLAERETATEALVEARDLAARVEQLTTATGPGGVRQRIDVELHRVAFLAPGGAGFEHGAVRHLDLDHVVVGVGIFLHVTRSVCGWFRPA
ncbi:hypothetical protein WR25_12491 [Diploscapter pachys]|uniref:Uncharacterized protein n=1 Tax=Diploscapter pachys TaxID=2018661 RepID=A0A2A2M2F3_9BILA|nr:hypothetical protein WR25_12491 [Diploscapter pachys]